MREPVKVLKSLSEKTTNKEYKFKRLYRNLYNPEFYFLAYKNISQSQGSMTPGVDGKSLDGMSEKRINALIESLKDFSYQPNPARRVYIEKKNSRKKRPLGIPSTEDKLVQEVVKMILESIYEPNFSDCSHGFRPNRSCHSALQQIQNQFTGITWFVEGDIHACFDSFDHHVLVNILRERIEDENFLALIWKMLKAGYMEQWVYNCTFSGTPQGSGVSPMLANIYLSKLDIFAEQLKGEFSKGKSKDNLEYSRAASKLYYIRRRNRANWEKWSEQQRKEALRLQKDAINYKHSLPSKRANNEDYKSLVYCRYADDFLIGVIGSYEDASEIKEKFRVFLKDTLHLEMSEEKTKITHNQDKARFLGYDITTAKNSALMYDSKHQLRKTHTGRIKLYADYSLFDGGVYDNPDISIHAALKDILEDMGVKATDKRIPVDYEELTEKGEAVEQAAMEARRIVSDFKSKTGELFHNIEGQSAEDVEQTVHAYIKAKQEEYDILVEIVDVVVSGSRCRGLEQKSSDLDVVVEYKGRENEDDLFNAFNEDGLMIGGVKVDINPITEGKTGTLATYLPGVESYLAEKRENIQKETVTVTEQKETVVTLTVAECGEFHNLGEFHEGIETVDEAIKLFMQIPPERMHGIPSIGINIHMKGTENFEDVGMDIISGKIADLEMLEYVPDISDNPKAIEVIGELIDKLPDIEVRGSFERFQTAVLAAQIDQLSYDFDTYQYLDTVEDRDAQIATIAEDIRSGNTGYLHDFLNAIVSDSIREGIVDVFGQGLDADNSEAIQTVRNAQELLDKLSAYKPLAKVEELEEGNYNMVDNVLNNVVEKKEQERVAGRISIREKLAEKKAAMEHKDKAVQKDQDRKTQREM